MLAFTRFHKSSSIQAKPSRVFQVKSRGYAVNVSSLSAEEFEKRIQSQMPRTLLRGKSGQDAKLLWALSGVLEQREQTFQSAETFLEALSKVPDLKSFLKDPVQANSTKLQVLKEKVFPEIKPTDAFSKFIEVLTAENRIKSIDKILKNFVVLQKNEIKDDNVTLTLAQQWPQEDLEMLLSFVRKIELNNDPKRTVTVKINPELEYGFTIKIGDRAFADFSGKTEIEQRKQQLQLLLNQVTSELRKY
eukprot:TRINITY_DN1554_c0_g1_i1.p1 TRINITY_DN1554_c0_g1~~TRINITY_DN1554_c0_g1_i1.p1  ORF type:complete len:247 (-),score=95.06 TRINITY_DN1554_c0_g1_i1:53-793(-)